jgi:hypothetical protein
MEAALFEREHDRALQAAEKNVEVGLLLVVGLT